MPFLFNDGSSGLNGSIGRGAIFGRAGGVGGSPSVSSATCRAVVAASVAALSALRAATFASVVFAAARQFENLYAPY